MSIVININQYRIFKIFAIVEAKSGFYKHDNTCMSCITMCINGFYMTL